MAELVHEVWIHRTSNGQLLESCCLAGPDGDDFGRTLSLAARLIHTFSASSYFEAMTICNRLLGRGVYTTDHAWDFEPYPEEWRIRQQRSG